MNLLWCILAVFPSFNINEVSKVIFTNVPLGHPEFKGFLSLDVYLESVGITCFSLILLCNVITEALINLLKLEASLLINKKYLVNSFHANTCDNW